MITAVMVIALLTAAYFIGKNSGKKSVEYRTETVMKYDTVTKVIREPYKVLVDKIKYVELPAKIDTVVVIKEFYSKHYVAREFKDTNIVITVKDTLYKNDVFSGQIQYKWLQPTQITTKTSVTNNYYKYVSLGFSSQSGLKSFSLDAQYHSKGYYFSVGYDPIEKITKFGVGTTLFRFK